MSILFFEGFETSGDETGLANQATTRPNVTKRWDAVASGSIPSTDSFFLIDDFASSGHALCMGTNGAFSFGNYLRWNVPEAQLEAPDGFFTDWVIGFRVHVPSTARTWSALSIWGLFGGTNLTEVIAFDIENSTNINVTRASPGAFEITNADGVLVPGSWHYIEVKFRIAEAAPVATVSQFTGAVTSGNYTLEVESDEGGPYTTANIPYNTNVAGILAAINTAIDGDIPNDSFNVGGSGLSGLLDGYITITADDQSVVEVEIDDVDLDGGSPGEVLHSLGGFVEVYVDGLEVINAQVVDTNNSLTTGFSHLRFENASVSGTGQDFVALDDIYIIYAEADTPHIDYLTPVRVRRLAPTADVLTGWTPSTGTDHYPLIDENGLDESDYVVTDINEARDRFTISDPVEDQEVLAVKVEVEALNAAGGTPSVTLEVVSGASIESSVFIVDDTVDYELFDMYVQEDPQGGDWTVTDIDAIQVGILFENNVS